MSKYPNTLTYIAEGIADSIPGDAWTIDYSYAGITQRVDRAVATRITEVRYLQRVELSIRPSGAVTAKVDGRLIGAYVPPGAPGPITTADVATPDLLAIAVLDELVQDGDGEERWRERPGGDKDRWAALARQEES